MAGRTGYTPIVNADPFGFDQINNIAAWFDGKTGESVANVAALPSSGNWDGRTVTAVAEGVQFVWLTNTWRPLAGYPVWQNAVPLSGAFLDTPDPLQYWWDGTKGMLQGTIWVTSPSTWQVSWEVCQALPADSGQLRVRPRRQQFMFAVSGSALLVIKVTTAGVVTVDRLVSGTTADWLTVMGVMWTTR